LKLFILADTRIVQNKGKFYIFNSVKYELEAIESLFSEISILGSEYDNIKETNTLEQCHASWKISSLLFPSNRSYIQLFFYSFKLFILTFGKIAKADVVHVRGPGIPMILGLLYSLIFPRKIWWFKYANDWSCWGRSTFWDIQKKLLLNFKWIKVTINGKWPNQPTHVITFENPCVWRSIDTHGKTYEINPELTKVSLKFIFVGRLTEEKGVLMALHVLKSISKQLGIRLKYTVVGHGPLENYLLEFISKDENFEFAFLGSMSKLDILEHYKTHDFIILPTQSPEGFPKSIAEGMAFGCIPIVTSISSIPQYIKHLENGLLLSTSDIENDLYNCVSELCFFDKDKLVGLKKRARELSEDYFTYERFSDRVESLVIN
jgi:glycosyltransferase involved in cell wall biosynthesis